MVARERLILLSIVVFAVSVAGKVVVGRDVQFASLVSYLDGSLAVRYGFDSPDIQI